MLRKNTTFQRKLVLAVLYINSSNRNFIPFIESVVSINALILWNKQISHAVNFEKANIHYDMTKTRHF